MERIGRTTYLRLFCYTKKWLLKRLYKITFKNSRNKIKILPYSVNTGLKANFCITMEMIAGFERKRDFNAQKFHSSVVFKYSEGYSYLDEHITVLFFRLIF